MRGSHPGTADDSINESGLLVQLVDISQIPFRAAPAPARRKRLDWAG